MTKRFFRSSKETKTTGHVSSMILPARPIVLNFQATFVLRYFEKWGRTYVSVCTYGNMRKNNHHYGPGLWGGRVDHFFCRHPISRLTHFAFSQEDRLEKTSACLRSNFFPFKAEILPFQCRGVDVNERTATTNSYSVL